MDWNYSGLGSSCMLNIMTCLFTLVYKVTNQLFVQDHDKLQRRIFLVFMCIKSVGNMC